MHARKRGVPFQALAAASKTASSLDHIVDAAKASGTLNLSSKGLGDAEVAHALHNLLGASPDANWWETEELRRLDISRNSCCMLPIELIQLTGLTALDVRCVRAYNRPIESC